MKLLYLHQYFKVPKQGGGLRSYYLSKALLDRGFTIEMISSSSISEPPFPNEGNFRFVNLKVPYEHNFSVLKRIKAFLKFSYKATQHLLKLKNAPLLYATSTPLSIGIPALIKKWLHKTPYIFEIRDLWPEAAIQLGLLKNPITRFIAHQLEYLIYTNASGIVLLSPDMLSYVRRKTKGKIPIEIIPNIADARFWQDDLARKLSEEILHIVYTGTVGIANGLGQVIPLLQALETQRPAAWRFTVMGEGNELEKFKLQLSKYGFKNQVFFLPKSDSFEVKKLLSTAHFAYISFAERAPVLASGSPNKFFDALAIGVPVIINFEGWIKKKITVNQLGYIQSQGAEKKLAMQLFSCLDRPRKWQTISENCMYASIAYSPQMAAKKLEHFIKSIFKN